MPLLANWLGTNLPDVDEEYLMHCGLTVAPKRKTFLRLVAQLNTEGVGPESLPTAVDCAWDCAPPTAGSPQCMAGVLAISPAPHGAPAGPASEDRGILDAPVLCQVGTALAVILDLLCFDMPSAVCVCRSMERGSSCSSGSCSDPVLPPPI